MTGICSNRDCTVAATGICLLSHPTLTDCPHYSGATVPATSSPALTEKRQSPEIAAQATAVAISRKAARTFHAGIELGTADAAEIMSGRYGHVIAVLGSTDVGKTCFLCSLYLMATNGQLPPGYIFSGSRSLQAFEDRARGLRKWKDGKLADEMVDHTHLNDTRQPSLLHLGLRRTDGERRRIELLLTDLPGEWTENLVKRASAAKSFSFMPRVDGLVLVVDGKLLLDDKVRHTVTQETIHFVDRLASEVKVDAGIPVVLLVSKSDEIDLRIPPAAEELASVIKNHGYRVKIISAAALSRSPEKVGNGTGVLEAIEAIIDNQTVRQSSAAVEPTSERSFGRFRG